MEQAMSTISTSVKDNPSPTRRRVVVSGAALAAAVFAGSPIAAAPTAAPALNNVDRQAIAFWERRARLITEWVDASAHEKAAEEQLPWWMKSGPCYLYADGSFGQETSPWPAIPDAKPPVTGVINIRPNEDLLLGLYKASRTAGVEAAQLAYSNELANLRARVEAREREYARLGLSEAVERSERAGDAIIDVEREIADLDCGVSPHAAAAMTLLMAREIAGDSDFEIVPKPSTGLFLAMLRLLRPVIGGLIADDVDRALAAADTGRDDAFVAAIDPRFAPRA